jgi:hypothetical protein
MISAVEGIVVGHDESDEAACNMLSGKNSVDIEEELPLVPQPATRSWFQRLFGSSSDARTEANAGAQRDGPSNASNDSEVCVLAHEVDKSSKEDEYQWCADAGSNRTVTNDTRDFVYGTMTDYVTKVKTGNGVVTSQHKGTVVLLGLDTNSKLTFTNTLHIDKKLCATKIVGGSPLTKKGCDISYKGSNVVLRDVNDEVLLKGKEIGGNFFYRAVVDHTKAAVIKAKDFFDHEKMGMLRIQEQMAGVRTMYGPDAGMSQIEQVDPEQARLLLGVDAADGTPQFGRQLMDAHNAMAHCNWKTLRQILGLKASGENPNCVACAIANCRQRGLSKSTYKRAVRPFFRMSLDIGFGKGGSVFQLVIDDFQRKSYLQVLASKADTLREWCILERRLANVYQPYTCAILHTDNESVYTSDEWAAYCERTGKLHEFSGRHKHGQNGVPERRMGPVGNGARAMSTTANTPERLFIYSLMHSNTIQNNLPTSANNGWSPNEKDAGIKLNASKYLLRACFGCLAFAFVYDAERKKHGDRGLPCVFLWWDDVNNVYWVEAWEGKRIFATTDITFHTRTFPYWSAKNASISRPLFDEHAPSRSVIIEEESMEGMAVRRSARGWQPTGRALRNIPDVAAAPDQEEHRQAGVGEQAGEAPAEGEVQLNHLYSIITHGEEPTSHEGLLNSPFRAEWIAADQEELNSHREHKSWLLVPRAMAAAEGAKVYKCKILRTNKLHPDGTLDKRKSRFVIAAYTKSLVQGIDYEEKYAGTARFPSILGIVAQAAHFDMELTVIDIKTFFLYGKLGENDKLYMEQPAGYEEPDKEDYVCKLLASIYGCPQGAYCAKKVLRRQLVQVGGFTELKSDDCVYVYRKGDAIVLMTTHVDDMLCATTPSGKRKLIMCLKGKFKIKVFDEPSIYTGILIERCKEAKWIKLHQGHYVRALLEKHGMTDCHPRATPIEVGLDAKRPEIGTSAADLKWLKIFQGIVGELMWLRCRADISRAVNFLCRFLTCAGETQVNWAKNVLRYLKGTPNMGLVFQSGGDLQLVGAVDADLAGDVNTSKSTSGFYVRAGKVGTVSVYSKLQSLVCDSTAMAETYAGKDFLKDLIWQREFHNELGNKQIGATLVRADNQAMIAQSKNPVNHGTSKHYRIAQHFNREQVENEVACFDYTSTKENEADMLTKALSRDVFERHRAKIMGEPQDKPAGKSK